MIVDTDPFLGRTTISRDGFAAVLRARPANQACLDERDNGQYWDACVGYGVDPNFVLAMFAHESDMGKAGVAVSTRSWGNTRSPSFGAVPIDEVPGRSGSFPVFAVWLAGCRSTAARLASLVWPTVAPYGARTSIAEVFDHPSGAVWAPAGDLNDPHSYLATMLRLMNRYSDQSAQAITATMPASPPLYLSYLDVNYTPGRANHSVRAVVLHVTQGESAAGCIGWFNYPSAKVSSHYVIDRDGAIFATVRDTDQAWVNGRVEHPNRDIPIVDEWVETDTNPNLETIGIECAGFSPAQPHPTNPAFNGYTDAQFASLAYLLPFLSARWGVPIAPDWTFGHNEISGTQRADCPGLSDAEWARIYDTAPGNGPYATADAAFDAWCAHWDDEVVWAGQLTNKQHWYGCEPQEVARTVGNRLLAYDHAYAQDATGWALDEWEQAAQAAGQLIIWEGE